METYTYDHAITNAKAVLRIADDEFRKLPPEQNHAVVTLIEDRFVEDRNQFWWWQYLREIDFVATHKDDAG